MNDTELDQVLNRWRTPLPAANFRARVLACYPRRAPRDFGRLLRWGVALMAAAGILVVAPAQIAPGKMANLSREMHVASQRSKRWLDQFWLAHIISAFHGSDPKIHVDGEERPAAEFGAKGATAWLRVPGEGKYRIAFHSNAFEGHIPLPAGRFTGKLLEFQAGAHTVRIESRHTYGFGGERPVYVLGPSAH